MTHLNHLNNFLGSNPAEIACHKQIMIEIMNHNLETEEHVKFVNVQFNRRALFKITYLG